MKHHIVTTAKPEQAVALPSGEKVSSLGLGTWHMGEDVARHLEEVATIRHALDLGVSMIDTAEMYGDGLAEELVGEAIAGRRNEAFLVSKVLPQHATASGTVDACERSLERLGTDMIDLYLLHWREDVPLEETLEGFAALVSDGKIRYWGVSNFDVDDMEDLLTIPEGADVATDEVLYNLTRRGSEWDLLPWLKGKGIPAIAYSPIEQGRLLEHSGLHHIARRHGVTPAQIALAWVLREKNVCAIPKAASREHLDENRAALDVQLTLQDLKDLDRVFPPPKGKVPLEVI